LTSERSFRHFADEAAEVVFSRAGALQELLVSNVAAAA